MEPVKNVSRRTAVSRRQLLQLIGWSSAGLYLAGCASSPPATPTQASSAPTQASKPPAAPVAQATSAPATVQPKPKGVVKFWHVWGGDRMPLMETQIADFEKLFPDIKIEQTLYSWTGLYEKYTAAIAGGSPPDIMMYSGAYIIPFADKGALMPLDDFIKRENFDITQFIDYGWKATVWKGKQYGMPISLSGGNTLLFHNLNAYEEAGLDPTKLPKTWTELVDVAGKLTVKKGSEIERCGFNFAGEWYAWQQWAACNNNDIFVLDGDKVAIAFDQPEGVEALEWMVDNINTIYGGWEKIQGFYGGTAAPGNAAFFGKKLAINLTGVWFEFMARNEAPDIKFAISLLPYNDKNAKAEFRSLTPGAMSYCMAQAAKNPDAAWEWLKYITAGEGNEKFCLAQKRNPATKKAHQNPAFAVDNPWWSVYVANAEAGFSPPLTPALQQNIAVFDQMLEEALYGRKSPRDAIKWAAGEVQKQLDEFYKG